MTRKQCDERTSVEFQVPPIFREFLKTRGIIGGEALQHFLFPRLVDLQKPGGMKNLTEAVNRVVEFMIAGKPIIIWGDYDVDGTCGTALLVNFFKECGVKVIWHIPNRLTDGYGLNINWFVANKNLFPERDFLVITVDCGISNGVEIAEIESLGGTVIVTDHHSLPQKGLPQCLFLNPSHPTCGFHTEQLAGVGVAFYLAAGIRAELLKNSQFSELAATINLKQYLAFVALGTLADMVDLTVTNRILVRAGMEALTDTPFTGLKELLVSSGITGGTDIVSEDIGYLLGPKINAAGRLGESTIVVTLLTEQDQKHAKKYAEKLTELNEERKLLSAKTLENSLTNISKSRVEEDKCIISKGPFHPGVAGIVAAKLVEIYGYPALVFAEKRMADNSLVYVGSGRSKKGINIIEILNSCSLYLERFGGHEMAAGMTVTAEKFTVFSAAFVDMAKHKWENHRREKRRVYDIECPVEHLMSRESLDFIRLLEPFGPGNLQPIFRDSHAKIVDARLVGRPGEHLQLTIRGKLANLKGIGFRLGNRIHEVQQESERVLVYTPAINRFRGNTSWQVRVLDF